MNFEAYYQIFENANPILKTIVSDERTWILNILEQQKELWLEKFETEMSEYNQKVFVLNLFVKIAGAMGKSILDTDKLVSYNVRLRAGSVEIVAVIERDGVEYDFITETILAGGHNIQRLHIRYITKGDLPKVTPNKTVVKKLNELTKWENKYQDLQKTLAYDKGQVEKYGALVKAIETKDRAFFINDYYKTALKYTHGADEQSLKSVEAYEANSLDYINERIEEDTCTDNLKREKRMLSHAKKELKKTEKKLEKHMAEKPY